MPEYKQGKIVEELLRRIREGVYAERLPLSQDLAQEFSVNFKTINKALNQLVADGILFRKKGCGTFLRTPVNIDGARMVEVLFEGYTTVSSHPFWGEIWSGVIKTLSANGYRPVLSMLEANPEGILNLNGFTFCESAGKLLLGVSEKRLVKLLQKETGVPFVSVADPVDEPGVLSVSIDDGKAIHEAIDYLIGHGAERIGFIGITCSYTNSCLAGRFQHYLDAVQRYHQIDPDLIENVRLLAENGYSAMKNILSRSIPDAVLVSGDHMIPGVVQALNEAGISVPGKVMICGCDGVKTDLPFSYPTIRSNRQLCGEKAAELLIRRIVNPSDRRAVSSSIPSDFSAS